jgi:hypothetical protein
LLQCRTIRVARWYIFKPKISIWVNFWKVLRWKMIVYFVAIRSIFLHLVYFIAIWYIYVHLVYFVIIWYHLGSFGIFSPLWYVESRKIWQPCAQLLRSIILFSPHPASFLTTPSFSRAFTVCVPQQLGTLKGLIRGGHHRQLGSQQRLGRGKNWHSTYPMLVFFLLKYLG